MYLKKYAKEVLVDSYGLDERLLNEEQFLKSLRGIVSDRYSTHKEVYDACVGKLGRKVVEVLLGRGDEYVTCREKHYMMDDVYHQQKYYERNWVGNGRMVEVRVTLSLFYDNICEEFYEVVKKGRLGAVRGLNIEQMSGDEIRALYERVSKGFDKEQVMKKTGISKIRKYVRDSELLEVVHGMEYTYEDGWVYDESKSYLLDRGDLSVINVDGFVRKLEHTCGYYDEVLMRRIFALEIQRILEDSKGVEVERVMILLSLIPHLQERFDMTDFEEDLMRIRDNYRQREVDEYGYESPDDAGLKLKM